MIPSPEAKFIAGAAGILALLLFNFTFRPSKERFSLSSMSQSFLLMIVGGYLASTVFPIETLVQAFAIGATVESVVIGADYIRRKQELKSKENRS